MRGEGGYRKGKGGGRRQRKKRRIETGNRKGWRNMSLEKTHTHTQQKTKTKPWTDLDEAS